MTVSGCPFYESWPDYTEGHGAMSVLISAGDACKASGKDHPGCGGDTYMCPLDVEEEYWDDEWQAAEMDDGQGG